MSRLMSLTETKAQLRRRLRGVLAALSETDRQGRSQAICQAVLRLVQWQKATTVLLHAPMPQEPNIWPLLNLALQSSKTVALPRYLPAEDRYEVAQVRDAERDVVRGAFGIREPASACFSIPLNQLDFTLVPGLGFDRSGRRLGRGKGFYDRLLEHASGFRCGIAFDEQCVEQVPTEPHDIELDCILTPSRVWFCGNRGA